MSKYLTRESPLKRIEDYFPRENYPDDTAWKLDVGAECNRLLEHAENMETEPTSDHGRSAAEDIRSIIKRVAKFEELERE